MWEETVGSLPEGERKRSQTAQATVRECSPHPRLFVCLTE
jgi:hypothetical protein